MVTSICPACGQDAFVPQGPAAGTAQVDEGTCSRCGYSVGESNRCPHCKGVARIEGRGVRSVCAICGGPRIFANFGGKIATDALREQQKALTTARLASVSTVIQAVFAALVTLVGLAVLPAAIMGKLVVFALAIVPLVLALRSRMRANRARANAKEAGERAWQAAAEDVAAHTKEGITVAALADTLGIELEHAEKLLTALAVHDRTRIDVGEDAEVRYSVLPETFARFGEEMPAEEDLAGDAKTLERAGRPS